jgi:hypothetical protein
MSFKYEQLNLEILEDAKQIFAKPATEWTAKEHMSARLIIAAMSAVADYYKDKP